MMSEAEDDVSCFTVDGVVAEMMIEVEDNQKSVLDDLVGSPDKGSCDKNDHDSKDVEFEDNHPEKKQPTETQPEEIQLIENQSEENQSEENQPEENQSEENQPEENQSEECQPEDCQPEECQPEESELEESELEESELDESQPKENQFEESELEESQPKENQFEESELEESELEESQFEESQPKENQFEESQPKENQFEKNQPKENKLENHPKGKQSEEGKQPKEKLSEKENQPEEKQLETEKKEDKENFIDTKIKDDNNDIKKNKIINKQEVKTGNISKRKRKIELSVNNSDNKRKFSESPRYPGRKRLANKRYISEDMITSKSVKSESQSKSLSKDTPKGPKKRKLSKDSNETKDEKVDETPDNKQPRAKKRKLSQDSNDTKVEKVDETPNNKQSKRLLRNAKESNLNVSKESVKFKKEESSRNIVDKSNKPKSEFKNDVEDKVDKPKAKYNTLRKLPFRKNKDAPDVPDLKPKVFWWNGVGEGSGMKLGDIPDVKEQIEIKGSKSVRVLYRVLFYQWPTTGQNIIEQILNFNGFPFDELSYEYKKRQSIMKIMLDVVLSKMCDILCVKKGPTKQTMIDNILNFLMRPYRKIDPTLDPSWQPVVVLEKIELDKYLEDMKTKATPKVRGSVKKNKAIAEVDTTPVRTFRNSRKIVLKSPVSKKSATKARDLTSVKTNVNQTDSSVSKETSKGKIASTKDNKLKTVKVDEKSSKAKKNETEEKPTEETDNKVKRGRKKKKKILRSQKLTEKNSSGSDVKQKSIDNEVKNISNDMISGSDVEYIEKSPESAPATKGKKKIPEKELKVPSLVSTINLSDSSETESAEETKLVTAKRKAARCTQIRKGKPLGHFPKISDSIQKANFSALQRLHILLFGASDKADNLKTNILAFGGFPFLDGSDEWKQKHFLLSLLAQNNLREYLNLLCIEYSDDDQPAMIDKLMKFLAAPCDTSTSLEDNIIHPIETEVVSSELVNKAPTSKGKTEIKKKSKKKEVKKTGNRHRKVLMSEEEARRLEASFAREQRAIARENKAPPPITRQQIVTPVVTPGYLPILPKPQIQTQTHKKLTQLKPPVTDPNQLNALLQTVYKRRALKAAGAVVSTPNKGEKTKLGDIENIKFLIVTGNLSDLEILHHLIYMMEASKTRLRKNILEFDGFGFNEDSDSYKERMKFLYDLGYDVSKRVSFLLGLCSLQSEISQQDLNELIMYFLMSPCRTKQVVPIREMPSVVISEENHILKPASSERSSVFPAALRTTVASPSKKQVSVAKQQLSSSPKQQPPSVTSSLKKQVSVSKRQLSSSPKQISKPLSSENIQKSTPVSEVSRQKARKSFPSSVKVKKVLLPPTQSPLVGAVLNKQALANKSPLTLFNTIPAIPSYSLAKIPTNVTVLNASNNMTLLNSPKSTNMNSLVKLPVNPGTKVQFLNQSCLTAIDTTATKIPVTSASNISSQISQNPVITSQLPSKTGMHPQKVVQVPLLQGPKPVMNNPTAYAPASQDFLVQQQTPDGQLKTFKLIRLSPNHPLASAVGQPSTPQTATTSPAIQQQVILTSPAPPGFVVVKNRPSLQPAMQNIQLKLPVPGNKVPSSSSVVISKSNASVSKPDEFILPDQGEPVEMSAKSFGNVGGESTSSIQRNPPSDKELFSSIQEVILSSNFEDITLRNVIERVSAQFPDHDLTQRHNYMKDCVKKIIIGT